MKKLIVVMALFAAPVLAQQADGVLEKPKRVQRNDAAMEAAYSRARETLDGFLELVASKPPHIKTPSVKVRLAEGKTVEDFWVTPFSPQAGGFGGFLQNEPSTIKKYKLGDPIRFTKADVVDWMYVDQTRKKIVGNYTGCVLLARGPAAERERARVQYGLDCTS